jgi:hypothetical protein
MSLIDAIHEVERELQVRSFVYPKMVQQGKLTPEEANRRQDALRFARLSLIEFGRRVEPTATPNTTE